MVKMYVKERIEKPEMSTEEGKLFLTFAFPHSLPYVQGRILNVLAYRS